MYRFWRIFEVRPEAELRGVSACPDFSGTRDSETAYTYQKDFAHNDGLRLA